MTQQILESKELSHHLHLIVKELVHLESTYKERLLVLKYKIHMLKTKAVINLTRHIKMAIVDNHNNSNSIFKIPQHL